MFPHDATDSAFERVAYGLPEDPSPVLSSPPPSSTYMVVVGSIVTVTAAEFTQLDDPSQLAETRYWVVVVNAGVV